jgi:membrane associated rhomboid family serine protease
MLKTFPPAVRAILIANIVMYGIQVFFPSDSLTYLELWPLASDLFRPYQLITYAFLHATPRPGHVFSDVNSLHLFMNMFALWMFGRGLEAAWGPRRFLVYYFASVLGAALTQLTVTALAGSGYPTIGASGGVFGVLLAFGLTFPRQKVIVLIAPYPIPAWLFVMLYGVAELLMGVFSVQSGVAHFAHLGGMLGGALVIVYWHATGQIRMR